MPGTGSPGSNAPLLRSGRMATVYRAVLERLPDAVAIIDLDGRYLEQNAAHHTLLGYSDRDLEGRTPAIHLGEDVFSEVAEVLAEAGQFRRQVVSTTRDGTRMQLTLDAFVVDDENGEPLCFVGVKHDLAADARAEDQLRHSVSLLRATLESTADGILVVDRAGRLVLHNRQFRALWGFGDDDLSNVTDSSALAIAEARVKDPDDFRAKVAHLYAHPDRTSFDVVEMRDGQILERFSRPQRVGSEIVGRVWSFRDVTEAHRTGEALRRSEERYRRLFTESPHAVYLTRKDGTFMAANPAALELFAITEADLPTVNSREFYADAADRRAFQEVIERDGSVEEYSVRLCSRDGRVMECLLTSTAQVDEDGIVIGYQGIIQDVTEQRRAERALRESEQKFRALIENASDTITILDAAGEIAYESPSLARVLGYRPEDLVGQNVFMFIHAHDRPGAAAAFERLVRKADATVSIELRFRHADGSWRWLDVVGQNMLENPAVHGVVVNARDVTERKAAEERLVHDAFHDRLTNLPNRALLMDRVAKLLQRAMREDASPFAVLFLDLDRFKVINDSLGHMVGDQLLTTLARRLQDCLRPGDTVARLGGDEFTMLLDGANAEAATVVAERVQDDLARPFRVGEHEVFTTVSIGIATSDTGYASPEEMLRDADLAMYRAKDRGRARHEVFDPSMRDEAVELLHLETDLRRALERAEFVVHYQPIVELATESLIGFEALIRWHHPERGLLMPGEFIQLAQDTGLIVPMGWWVVDEVIRQLGEWHADPAIRSVPVQINISAHQLARPDLLDRLETAFEAVEWSRSLIHLELTEGTMMENAEATARTLERLKRLGIGLSIDDFGTGYSSLSYLHRFPTDSVKIDRSFVARMRLDGEGVGMVRTIVDLAHDLGMRTVAEGVETRTQVALLQSMRCEAAQGFLYDPALPAEEARAWLVSGRPDAG